MKNREQIDPSLHVKSIAMKLIETYADNRATFEESKEFESGARGRRTTEDEQLMPKPISLFLFFSRKNSQATEKKMGGVIFI